MRLEVAKPWESLWLAARASCHVTPTFVGIAAKDAEGRIHGMVGFDAWTPNSVEVHLALDSSAALRTLLRPSFAYAFGQMARGLMRCTIIASNTRSLRVAERLGFEVKYRMRDGWAPGVDVLHLELRREACRWWEPTGKQKAA